MRDLSPSNLKNVVPRFLFCAGMAWCSLAGCVTDTEDNQAGRPVDFDQMPSGEVEDFQNPLNLTVRGKEYSIIQGIRLRPTVSLMNVEDYDSDTTITFDPSRMFGIEFTNNNLAVFYALSNIVFNNSGEYLIPPPFLVFSDNTSTPYFDNQGGVGSSGQTSVDPDNFIPVNTEGVMYDYDFNQDGEPDVFIEFNLILQESEEPILDIGIYTTDQDMQLIGKNRIKEIFEEIQRAGKESA